MRNSLQFYLGAVFRPSLRRDAFLSVLLTAIIGMAALLFAIAELQRQTELANLANAAGRLRMLSQRTAYMTYLAADGDQEAKAQIEDLHSKLEDGIREVEAQGFALGVFRNDADLSMKLLVNLKYEWSQYHGLTSSFAQRVSAGKELSAAKRNVGLQADALVEASDAMVDAVLAKFTERRDQLRSLLPLAYLGVLFLPFTTFIYVHWILLRPLSNIGRTFEKIAQGDLSIRVPKSRHDELGVLIERINGNIDAIERLKGEQEFAQQAIHDSELRNRTMWEVSTDAIVMIDADSIIRYTNPAVAEIFGYSPLELNGQHISVLQPERFRSLHLKGFSRFIESRERRLDWSGIEMSALHKGGQEIPVELSFAHMVLSGQDWFVGFFRDITLRIVAQEGLRIRDLAIESTSEGVMITDSLAPDHPIIYINPALERISGYTAEELIGKSGRMLLADTTEQIGAQALRQILREHKDGTVEVLTCRKNQERLWVELSVAPVRNTTQKVSHYVSIFKDITERKAQEAALMRSANYDALTGLPNRALLYDRLTQSVSSAERHQREIGVLFVDLDNFKLVNDSLGHVVGDKLLVAISERINAGLREEDTLARWGGDEFVILLADLDNANEIATVARRILTNLDQPLRIGEHTIHCTTSIGGSVFPKDGKEPDELLQHADIAMYRAKEQGRNAYQLFSHEMQHNIDRRLMLETQLRNAIARNELSLHFQPQIALNSGRVVGAEALLRWRHPELGMVSPALFIPVAEESGLITLIGDWVLETACAEARHWKEQGIDDITLAINFSARQFMQANLPLRLGEVLAAHGLEPRDIEIEITESMVMHSPAKAIDVLTKLKNMGINAAIDDFGTGYSSLAYLKNFPVNYLKIDKSFVQDAAIVRAVIQLAISYNMKTVAEGVEDEATVRMLDKLGCDIVQGYYYSRPLPSEAFVKFARQSLAQV